jgi:hypothetical protein
MPLRLTTRLGFVKKNDLSESAPPNWVTHACYLKRSRKAWRRSIGRLGRCLGHGEVFQRDVKPGPGGLRINWLAEWRRPPTWRFDRKVGWPPSLPHSCPPSALIGH